MNEDAALRRANLKAYCAAPRNWGPTDLMTAAGFGTYAYWRNLLAMPSKAFGEKVARRIEGALGLPRGWLDADHGAEQALEDDQTYSKLAMELAHSFDSLRDILDHPARKALYIRLQSQINSARVSAIRARQPAAEPTPAPTPHPKTPPA